MHYHYSKSSRSSCVYGVREENFLSPFYILAAGLIIKLMARQIKGGKERNFNLCVQKSHRNRIYEVVPKAGSFYTFRQRSNTFVGKELMK